MPASHSGGGKKLAICGAESLDSALQDVRRIVFGSRRNQPPGFARVSLATQEVQETVNEQAATQEGLTLAVAREFAERNGMTLQVGPTPEGPLRFSFVVGDEVLVSSSTIRGAFVELAVYLERESRLLPAGGTGSSAAPRFGGW